MCKSGRGGSAGWESEHMVQHREAWSTGQRCKGGHRGTTRLGSTCCLGKCRQQAASHSLSGPPQPLRAATPHPSRRRCCCASSWQPAPPPPPWPCRRRWRAWAPPSSLGGSSAVAPREASLASRASFCAARLARFCSRVESSELTARSACEEGGEKEGWGGQSRRCAACCCSKAGDCVRQQQVLTQGQRKQWQAEGSVPGAPPSLHMLGPAACVPGPPHPTAQRWGSCREEGRQAEGGMT